jgi:hypothetical protein
MVSGHVIGVNIHPSSGWLHRLVRRRTRGWHTLVPTGGKAKTFTVLFYGSKIFGRNTAQLSETRRPSSLKFRGWHTLIPTGAKACFFR